MPHPDGLLLPPVLLSILLPVLCRDRMASCFLRCSCQFFLLYEPEIKFKSYIYAQKGIYDANTL